MHDGIVPSAWRHCDAMPYSCSGIVACLRFHASEIIGELSVMRDGGYSVPEAVRRLFNRDNDVSDGNGVSTDCDGMRTVSVTSKQSDGSVLCDRYQFPAGWFDGHDDSNSMPWHEQVVSQDGMVLSERRNVIDAQSIGLSASA